MSYDCPRDVRVSSVLLDQGNGESATNESLALGEAGAVKPVVGKVQLLACHRGVALLDTGELVVHPPSWSPTALHVGLNVRADSSIDEFDVRGGEWECVDDVWIAVDQDGECMGWVNDV